MVPSPFLQGGFQAGGFQSGGARFQQQTQTGHSKLNITNLEFGVSDSDVKVCNRSCHPPMYTSKCHCRCI